MEVQVHGGWKGVRNDEKRLVLPKMAGRVNKEERINDKIDGLKGAVRSPGRKWTVVQFLMGG